MRCILTIEYAYIRLCIFSVALQAVINRRYYDAGSQDAAPPGSTVPQQEEEHLRQTVKAAQTILRTVIDDLLTDGHIKCLPVRSYSRILGAALFLLKVRSQCIIVNHIKSHTTSFLTNSVTHRLALLALQRLISPRLFTL